MFVALLTNNPGWFKFIGPWTPWESFNPRAPQAGFPGTENRRSFLFAGPALEVLLAGRGLLHAGWRLLHHPLYGNFRPHQQPFRSLLWRFEESSVNEGGLGRLLADEWSLRLLEEALHLYQNSPAPSPGQAPPALREACALLDLELLRPALEQAGWPCASPASQGLEAQDIWNDAWTYAWTKKGCPLETGTP